ncbi:MAG: hypothetical protein JW936_02285 [Sedimentisphaerales bacterium]|nr:hypothetical protein [Sedimentisphaerales bacterium]
MSWQKIKTYTKLTLIGLVVLAAILFMLSNMQHVTVKFLWWKLYEVPTAAFIFIVGNAGILVYLVMKRLRKVISEIKAMRREKQARHRLDDAPKKTQVSKPQDE